MSEPTVHLPECSGTSARILLAEDDVLVRGTCSHALRRAGYSVEAVANGVEAWDALQTHSFDLLVTDNNMPCLSGEELILKLRRVGMTLPIIGMTASDKFFSSEANEQLADTLCLRKPFDFSDILNAIRRLLCDAGRTAVKPHPTNLVSVRTEHMNRPNDRC